SLRHVGRRRRALHALALQFRERLRPRVERDDAGARLPREVATHRSAHDAKPDEAQRVFRAHRLVLPSRHRALERASWPRIVSRDMETRSEGVSSGAAAGLLTEARRALARLPRILDLMVGDRDDATARARPA